MPLTWQTRCLLSKPCLNHTLSRIASACCSGWRHDTAPLPICHFEQKFVVLHAAMGATHEASTSNSDELQPLGLQRNSFGGSGGSGGACRWFLTMLSCCRQRNEASAGEAHARPPDLEDATLRRQ